MAPVRDVTAPVLNVIVQGANGDRASTVFYQSDYTLIDWGDGEAGDPLYDLLASLKTLIEGVSVGSVAGYQYMVNFRESNVTTPDANSNVNDVGQFTFMCADGKKMTVNIPAIDPTVLVPSAAGTSSGTTAVAYRHGRQLINVGNASVSAFVQFVLTGAEGFIPGANRIVGTSAPVAIQLQDAFAVQRASPVRMYKAGI